jgi:phosphomannomutase
LPIKFGTDGWRAIIAEDFTFENVRVCAAATAKYIQGIGASQQGIVIGYDTRFGSYDFALAAAKAVAAVGVSVTLLDKTCPTPVVSYTVVDNGFAGGIVITASHNPPQWNGFKFKPSYGGSASTEVVSAIEAYIADIGDSFGGVPVEDSDLLIKRLNPDPSYLNHIATLIDLESIKSSGLSVIVDAMHGSGAGYFGKLVSGGSTSLVEIRSEVNPSFPNMEQPEPIHNNLVPLQDAVRNSRADVGIALDGDADRVGICDEHGNVLTPLQIFGLLGLYLLEVRSLRGPLIKSLTSTAMIYRLGEKYGVPVIETPVGFKHIAPLMLSEGALLGGEESGGYGFGSHIPERDGILSGLFILDMVHRTGKSISELLEWLYSLVGPHEYVRHDLTITETQKSAILEAMEAIDTASLSTQVLKSRDTTDGTRFVFESGAWVVARMSGTEPLLRVYAEGSSQAVASDLVSWLRTSLGV